MTLVEQPTQADLELYRDRPLRVCNGPHADQWIHVPTHFHNIRLLVGGEYVLGSRMGDIWEYHYSVELFVHTPTDAGGEWAEDWIGPLHGPTIYEWVLRTHGPGHLRHQGVW